MKYVLQRTDSWGGDVTRPGWPGSYTNKLQHARVFDSKEAAERERCPGNEVIVSVDEAMRR